MAIVKLTRTGKEVNRRVNNLREKMLRMPEICIERGYLLTESYKETESKPPIIRRAKALEKVLNEMTLGIDDEELIVGRTTSKPRGGLLIPEVQWEWYLNEMDLFSTRAWDKCAPLAEEEKAKMREFLPYWKGKALEALGQLDNARSAWQRGAAGHEGSTQQNKYRQLCKEALRSTQ